MLTACLVCQRFDSMFGDVDVSLNQFEVDPSFKLLVVLVHARVEDKHIHTLPIHAPTIPTLSHTHALDSQTTFNKQVRTHVRLRTYAYLTIILYLHPHARTNTSQLTPCPWAAPPCLGSSHLIHGVHRVECEGHVRSTFVIICFFVQHL